MSYLKKVLRHVRKGSNGKKLKYSHYMFTVKQRFVLEKRSQMATSIMLESE